MPSGDQTSDVFRIAAFSGFTGDNWRALKQQVPAAPVLFGDYLAEMVSCLTLASCTLAPPFTRDTPCHLPTSTEP